jgi:hypothetical protein
MVNGQPAKEAMVVFHHVDDWGERSIVPQGITDENGHFELSTYAMNDGAPAGDYQVSIIWPEYRKKNLGPDQLKGKYGKAATSGLTAHVDKGPNVLPTFELKAELPKGKSDATSAKPKSNRRKDKR